MLAVDNEHNFLCLSDCSKISLMTSMMQRQKIMLLRNACKLRVPQLFEISLHLEGGGKMTLEVSYLQAPN